MPAAISVQPQSHAFTVQSRRHCMLSRSSAVVSFVIRVKYAIAESNRHVLPNNDRFADSFDGTKPKQLKRQIAQESFSG
jgi:hypothetical protein